VAPRFGSFIELNAWLGERCRSVWADTTHPIHRQFTVAEMWELEKGHLMSMPAPFDGCRTAGPGQQHLPGGGRPQPVPCPVNGLAIVSTRVYPGRIDVATADAVVASHRSTARQRPDQLRLAALHRSGAARRCPA
jgi:hypothetical protein